MACCSGSVTGGRPAVDDFADALRRDECRPSADRLAQRGSHPVCSGCADGTSRSVGISLQLCEKDALQWSGSSVVGGLEEGNDQWTRITQRSAPSALGGIGISRTPLSRRAASRRPVCASISG
jgi:hypothetical protein